MKLEVRDLTKSFEGNQVLHGISFEVESGSALGLLGRNGAGKTTTIRIIMDVFKADEGEVYLDDEPFNPKKHLIGYLPEERGLYPENYWFLADVLSYVAVGARSVEDQQHRLTVSGMDVPAGMKNPTSGDFSVMLNSVIAAQAKQSFIYRNWEVETPGNPLAHTILRGAVNKHGQNIPNYHYEDLIRLANMYKTKDLLNPACIVDANHSNSGKMYAEQIRITKEVIHSRNHSNDVKQLVKGVMIESYIEPGCQKVGEGVYGKSITDPCLGWEESEKLLYTIADMLK